MASNRSLSRLMRCIALLLLFWAAVTHFLIVLPPFEGSDEDKHFGYITHLRQTGQFPDPRQSLQLPARQASGQAPLYYLLVRLWSELAPTYDWNGSLPLNPYVNPVRPVVGWPDNANVFMFGPDQIPANPPLVSALMWQRFLSPFMGMTAVALAYAAARMLLSRTWAAFAMLLFAFNPVLIFMFSYVTNDAAAILASAASTFCLVLLVRRPFTVRGLLVSGMVIGLGALTKANVLVFAPVAVMAVTFRNNAVEGLSPRLAEKKGNRTKAFTGESFSSLSNKSGQMRLLSPFSGLGFFLARGFNPWRREFLAARLRNAVILSLPIVLIGAPWYVWNAAQYGDPFGIQPHLRTFWALSAPRSMGDTLRFTLDNGAYQIRSLWYGVASGVVMSTHNVLIAPVGLLILSIIGYVRGWRKLIRHYCLALLTLGLICTAIFAAYVRWLTFMDSVTGRLLLPGYPALALLVTLGLAHGWSRQFMRGVRLVAGAAIVFGAVIVTGNITLPGFYTMFTMSPDAIPPLSGETARFGDAEFMGYRIEPERLTPGVLPRATACWRSLREDGRLEVPYAFAFHIVGQDGVVYYGRDSYPGMGLYRYWQPGRAFCDRFTLEERQAVVPGRGYRVAIALFDSVSLERVPENDDKTFVGWIATPGAALTDSERDGAKFNFEGVYLLDYSMSVEGDTLTVTTSWGTGEWQPRALTAFIHVVDANGMLVTQLDTPLGGAEYPSGLWDSNERAYSTVYELALPDAIPPGEYTVLFGLYDSQSLARLAAMDAEGVPQTDNVVGLGMMER